MDENKVEMSPIWQQRKLRELCRSNDIVVTAYSVLGSRGAFWGTPKIMESDVLKEIAEAKEKTVAQVLSKVFLNDIKLEKYKKQLVTFI